MISDVDLSPISCIGRNCVSEPFDWSLKTIPFNLLHAEISAPFIHHIAVLAFVRFH